MLCVFTTYVRPLLEYNSVIWSPRYVYLKDKLESVQRRFTKRLKGFGHISHAARLDRLKAETLELRRLTSDLTMTFSIIRDFVDIDCNSLFRVIDCESVHTRGHNLRLYKATFVSCMFLFLCEKNDDDDDDIEFRPD